MQSKIVKKEENKMKKIFFCIFTVLSLVLICGQSVNKERTYDVSAPKTEIKTMKSYKDDNNDSVTSEIDSLKEYNEKNYYETLEKGENLILQCESALNKNNSSVENELNNQIIKYEQQLKILRLDENKNNDQIQNVINLINDLKSMLNQYVEYTNNESEKSNTNDSAQTYMAVADPDALLSLSYPAAHAAIVSYFSNSGYTLAAELLTHMKSNTSYDSTYKPVNSNIVYENDVFKNIAYKSEQRGTGEFKSGDLYMAIHYFNYSKSVNNTAVVLTDRYDFAFSTSYDHFLTQSAVNMMACAEDSGYLTPYYVVVEYSNSTNLNNDSNIKSFPISSWRYSETMATLGKGENITYTVTFPTSGCRNIQTFGYNDSYLTIQSSTEDYLISNDDSGYERNAFVNYYFNSNESYRIVLRFYSSSSLGNCRVAITPCSYSNYDNINTLERTWSFFNTYYKNVEVNNSSNEVSMFLLKPATTSSFSIQTTKKNDYVDTYLYYIDPRRADMDKDDYSKNEYLKSCISNDDGAGNLQAKLSLGKHDCSVPYLIIASTFSSYVSGNFYLDINGLDSSHGLVIL